MGAAQGVGGVVVFLVLFLAGLWALFQLRWSGWEVAWWKTTLFYGLWGMTFALAGDLFDKGLTAQFVDGLPSTLASGAATGAVLGLVGPAFVR